jgi:uncharacterized protein with FMN-binding domain
MKKTSLSLSVIISFVLFSLFGRKTQNLPLPLSPVPDPLPTPAAAAADPIATLIPSSVTPPPRPSAVPVRPSGFRDGSYTGDVADAFYGNIQVRAVISGGRLTDVQFLQYPSDRRTSVEINTQAMPYLKAEALQAQSSQVDIVSGATDSSLAFIQSLGSALSQAR